MSQFFAKWKDGFYVIWRNLSWKEYKQFQEKYESSLFSEPMSVNMEIYKTAKLEGPDPEFVPAGIAAYIAKHQMLGNPFSGRFEDVAKAVILSRRAVGSNYLESMKGIIANSLNYTPEEIDEWEPQKFFVRAAQAEIAIGRTFDPVDPSAKKKGNRAADDPEVKNALKKKELTPAQRIALDRAKRDRASGA